ncbi:MAG: flagellar basal body P-ring protein FlgI [Deltaproteobacteria bacterium]|nr:flagellar basal body P-ring protein FlgI [Deltaproteobacteria bacterium]
MIKILPGVFVIGILVLWASDAYCARVKDIAGFGGVRENQLVGYGLVVGLNGTGDKKDMEFTILSMANMLERMGVTVRANDIEVENVAAVMVIATLPPFAKTGSNLDCTVSSIGDAESLEGGVLLLTPLVAVDGNVYAVAQGPVSVGGFSAGGGGGKIQKNFPTVGRVVGGALIEKEVDSNFNGKETLSLTLRHPDFTTVSRLEKLINRTLDDHAARTVDAATIEIAVPEKYSENIVALVSLLEGLDINPDMASKVVINERTGTVVIGEKVRISTLAISHGNLSIEIKETPSVSQPLPFSAGETVVVPETEISVKEERNPLFLVESGVSIGEVVRGLNALGVSPRDLIAIFQAIKAAGALQAELEII